MSWPGEGDRHALVAKLAAMGVELKSEPKANMVYVPRLDNIVKGYVRALGEAFDDYEVTAPKGGMTFDNTNFMTVISSEFLDHERPDLLPRTKRMSKEQKNAFNSAPVYILGADNNTVQAKRPVFYVFAGTGGEWAHPPLMEGGETYPDNHYLAPFAVNGRAHIIFPKAETLYGIVRERTGATYEVPFDIGGLVGVKLKAANEMPAGTLERKLQQHNSMEG